MDFTQAGTVSATGEEERVLCLAMRAMCTAIESEELRQLVSRIGIECIAKLAAENSIKSLLGAGLVQAGIVLPVEWEMEISANGRRVRILVEALSRVVVRLGRLGIRSAAIEAGGVFMGTGMPPEAYCPGDIDLLVAADGWPLVASAFEAEGFVANPDRLHSKGRIEFRKRLPEGTILRLEAGYLPFDRRWVPSGIRDMSQEWLTNLSPSIKDPMISVLSPTEALVSVAIHASLHSFVRKPGLRLHVDVDRLVRDQPVDWERFIAAVVACQASRRVFVSLAMAEGLLGTPVPTDVLRRLNPGPCVCGLIGNILSRAGILADGSQRLGKVDSVRLESLLDERGFLTWGKNAFFPPAVWMHEHFEIERESAGIARLHVRRLRGLLRL